MCAVRCVPYIVCRTLCAVRCQYLCQSSAAVNCCTWMCLLLPVGLRFVYGSCFLFGCCLYFLFLCGCTSCVVVFHTSCLLVVCSSCVVLICVCVRADQGSCQGCHPSCKSCSGQGKRDCLTCPPGEELLLFVRQNDENTLNCDVPVVYDPQRHRLSLELQTTSRYFYFKNSRLRSECSL